MTRVTDLRGENIIDSRNVIERFHSLESDRDTWKADADTPADADTWTAEDGTVFTDTWSEDEESEYQALKALDAEASSYAADWLHGATLIADSYFEKYAQELADDLGLTKDCNQWPLACIDWERAARELQYDYTSVEFDGSTYWMRA